MTAAAVGWGIACCVRTTSALDTDSGSGTPRTFTWPLPAMATRREAATGALALRELGHPEFQVPEPATRSRLEARGLRSLAIIPVPSLPQDGPAWGARCGPCGLGSAPEGRHALRRHGTPVKDGVQGETTALRVCGTLSQAVCPKPNEILHQTSLYALGRKRARSERNGLDGDHF